MNINELSLWVKFSSRQPSKVRTTLNTDVDDFLMAVKNNSQLGIPKDSIIELSLAINAIPLVCRLLVSEIPGYMTNSYDNPLIITIETLGMLLLYFRNIIYFTYSLYSYYSHHSSTSPPSLFIFATFDFSFNYF